MKESVMKKVISLLLCAVMLMGILPGAVYAENPEGEVPVENESIEGEIEAPPAPAGLSDAEYQAVVTRVMSGWKFPLPEACFGSIAAFAGSKNGDESTFYRVSEGGSDSLVVRASGSLEVYAPQGGKLYRSSYPDAQRGNVAVIEGYADNSYAYYAIISSISDSAPVASGTEVQPGALIGYTGGADVSITCLMDAAGKGAQLADNLSTSLSGVDWLTESYGTGLICVNPSAQTVSSFAGYMPGKFAGPVTYGFVTPQPVQPEPPAHEHTWDGGVVILPATCTAEGQTVYTCSGCGEQKTEPIPMAHVFDQSVVADAYLAAPATCQSPAQYYYTCTCGAVGTETFTSGEAGGHTWDAGQVTQAASHTAEGQTVYTCTVCGEQRAEAVPAGGDHVFDQSVVADAYLAAPATCQSPAQYYYTCTCGAVGTETFTSGEAGGHVWDAGQVTQAASHTAEGQTVYTCTVCGEQRAEAVPAGGDHVFDQSVVADAYLAAPATCQSPAQYYYTCTCGAVGTETFTSGEAGGHVWDAGQVTQAASHTAEGQVVYTCTVCGEQRAEAIPAGGDHVFDQQIADERYLVSPATCQSPAVYRWSCVCGEAGTETFTSGDAVEHTWNEGVITVDPTHTAPGEKTYTCTVCNQTRTEELPASAEHVYDQMAAQPQYLVSEATCTSPAQYVMSCVCGAAGTETFPSGEAKGHSFAPGWSMDTENHWHSATCEHTDEKGDWGPHNWDDGTITVHAGHNTDGQKVYTCVACGQQKTEVVPGQPHEYNQMIPDSKYLAAAATCTSPATYYKSCTCGAAGTETFTDGQAKGHTFASAWSSNDLQHWQAATCEHTGEKIRIGDHIWDPGVITVQPTANSKGVKTYTCAVCGKTKTEELAPSAHLHTYSTAWAGNTTYHWHPATCEHTAEVNGVALHTWNTGVVTVWASHSAPGEKVFTCTVCGMTKKEAVPAEHSYTQQNPSNNYLKSAATCTSPAVYYKSCTCGAKGTETFTYGSALGHSYSGSWGKDENYHWSLCTRCGARGELAVHTYNQSNVCSVCSYSKAESHVHSSHLSRVPAKTATCTQPGNVAYYTCSCGKWFSDPSTSAEITDQSSVVTPAVGHVDQNKDGRCDVCKERMAADTVEYQITEGADATWLTSSNKGMVVRSSADYSKFDHVEVDGSTISSLNYTVTSGSTVVELSANYMKRLTVGSHSIAIVSKDGTAKTGFTVKQGAATGSGSSGSAGWMIVIVIAILIAIAIPVGIGYYVYKNKTSGGKYSR